MGTAGSRFHSTELEEILRVNGHKGSIGYNVSSIRTLCQYHGLQLLPSDARCSTSNKTLRDI